MAARRQGHQNPDLHRSMVERARSGSAGSHGDRRLKRQKTRSAAKARALKDW